MAMAARHALRLGLLATFLTLFLACTAGDRPPASSRASVRDSAGIRILTFPPGEFADTVSGEPVLTVGREGDPDYEFFRVATVLGLGSGNLMVANGGTHELRFFDGNGQFLRSVGRNGEGPAEFGFLSDVWLRPGDTLVVLDPGRRRLAYFDSAGTFLRGESYSADLAKMQEDGEATGPCLFPGLRGLLADGTRLIHGWGCMQFRGGVGRRPTNMTLELVGEEGRTSLGTFNVAWVWERGSTQDPRESYSMIPFQGTLRHLAGRDRVFVSMLSEYEVRVFDPEGRLVSILREDTVPPPVTDADVDALLAGFPEGRSPFSDDVPTPDRFGSYDLALLSHEGDLWARRVPRPDTEVRRWVVFSADGGGIRRLVLPDVDVQSIRGGRIFARRTDSLGIQTVVVLEVPEAGSGP
jgi:hypothetical protein